MYSWHTPFVGWSEWLLCTQVLASFINPGGLIPKEFEATSAVSETFTEKEDSEQSLLPAVLPELLTQSCLVPALSSYLRNDSGAVLLFCNTCVLMSVDICAVRSCLSCHLKCIVHCCNKIFLHSRYRLTFCQQFSRIFRWQCDDVYDRKTCMNVDE